MYTNSNFIEEMNKFKKNKSLLSQIWSFICGEGLPCLFVILMLCNGLFFAYALIARNNTDSLNASSQHELSTEVDKKNNYIN